MPSPAFVICRLFNDDQEFFNSAYLIEVFCFVLFFFSISRAASVAHVGSQARGLIGTIAAGLYHSHSNTGSELRLQPIPQLTAMPDA